MSQFNLNSEEFIEVLINRVKNTDRAQTDLYEAIHRYGPKSQIAYNKELQIISKRNAKALNLINPYAVNYWFETLVKSFEEVSPNLTIDWTITAIEKLWDTNDEEWDVDITSIRKTIQNALKGLNYIGMIEFGYIISDDYECGKRVCPHFQGLCWGDIPDRKYRKIQKKFSGGYDGASGLVRTICDDMEGALSYAFKHLSYAYKHTRTDNRRYTNRCSLTKIKRYKLFKHTENYLLPDLTIAGGEGQKILNYALKLLSVSKQG